VHVVGHENLNQSTENNSLKIKIETDNCYVQTETMYKMFVWTLYEKLGAIVFYEFFFDRT